MVPPEAERSDFDRRTWEASATGTDVSLDSETMPPPLPGMEIRAPFDVSIFGPTEAIAGSDVTFSGASTTDGTKVVSYEWTIHDESKAGKEVTHTFEDPETYDVELKIRDEEGRIATETSEVEVVPGGAGEMETVVEDTSLQPEGTGEIAVTSKPVPRGIAGFSLRIEGDPTVAAFEDVTIEQSCAVDASVSDGAVGLDVADVDEAIEPGTPEA
jgi:hypothetical protein